MLSYSCFLTFKNTRTIAFLYFYYRNIIFLSVGFIYLDKKVYFRISFR